MSLKITVLLKDNLFHNAVWKQIGKHRLLSTEVYIVVLIIYLSSWETILTIFLGLSQKFKQSLFFVYDYTSTVISK